MKMRFAALVTSASICFWSAAAQRNDQAVLEDGYDARTKVKNVAIIGAGAAGSSAAYYLKRFAEGSGLAVNITVFERNDYVGGRTTTVYAYDMPSEPVELGGSIFVEVNTILVNAAKEFNLSTSGFQTARQGIKGPALGVWNGQEFIITAGVDSTWWNTAKLLWRYGLASLRTRNLMKATTAKFFSMYNEPIFPFKSLTQVLQDVGLTAVTAATGEQYLSEDGISNLFATEIIQASTRVNYAQNLPYIHGLETMVCMATEGAMSVEGGNWQIFAEMLRASGATVRFGTRMTALDKKQDGSYIATAKASGNDAAAIDTSTQFDTVILAAPFQYANLSIKPASFYVPDEIPYVQLHVTLFTSPHLLSPGFFGLPVGQPAPHVVLTTLAPSDHAKSGPEGVGSAGFFSISLLRQVDNPLTGSSEYLYKIFSPEPPNSTFLASLLGLRHHGAEEYLSEEDMSWMHRKVWDSYPYEFPRITFEEIQLDDDLWYTSGIESLISTMETSALMGKNVARLITDAWMQEASEAKGVMWSDLSEKQLTHG